MRGKKKAYSKRKYDPGFCLFVLEPSINLFSEEWSIHCRSSFALIYEPRRPSYKFSYCCISCINFAFLGLDVRISTSQMWRSFFSPTPILSPTIDFFQSVLKRNNLRRKIIPPAFWQHQLKTDGQKKKKKATAANALIRRFKLSWDIALPPLGFALSGKKRPWICVCVNASTHIYK